MGTIRSSLLSLVTILGAIGGCPSAPERSGAIAEPPGEPDGRELSGATAIDRRPTCTDADGDGAQSGTGCRDLDCDDSDPRLGVMFETDCGRCVEGCEGEAVGAGTSRPFDAAPPRAAGVLVDEDGTLLPAKALLVPSRFLWITEPATSVVVKIDPATGIELARYRTAAAAGAEPRLVAVRPDGRALVLNHRTATAAIIAAADCPDRDGDGIVTTSSRREELLPWRIDECLLGEVALGALPSAVAIVRPRVASGSGRFFGWYASGATLEEIDLDTVALTGRTVNLQPASGTTSTDVLSLVAGRGGVLWAASATTMFSMDAQSLEVHDFQIPTARLALDLASAPDGRIWLTGSKGATLFDPASSTFETIEGACGSAIAVDARGVAFVAEGDLCDATGVARIDPVTREVTEAHPAGTITGVAVDLDGWAWAMSSAGATFRVHPDTLVSDPGWMEHGATQTHGDLTGAALANVLAEPGRLTTTVEGCADPAQGTSWSLLRWYADVPRGTSLSFEVRAADTQASLATTPAARVEAPATEGEQADEVALASALTEAGGAEAELLEVTVELASPAHAKLPRLVSFEAYHACSSR